MSTGNSISMAVQPSLSNEQSTYQTAASTTEGVYNGIYNNSQNSLVLSGTGKAVYSNPGSPKNQSVMNALRVDQRPTNYCENQLPLSVNPEATMVISDADHSAYKGAFASMQGTMTLVQGSEGDELPNISCSTRNSIRERMSQAIVRANHNNIANTVSPTSSSTTIPYQPASACNSLSVGMGDDLGVAPQFGGQGYFDNDLLSQALGQANITVDSGGTQNLGGAGSAAVNSHNSSLMVTGLGNVGGDWENQNQAFVLPDQFGIVFEDDPDTEDLLRRMTGEDPMMNQQFTDTGFLTEGLKAFDMWNDENVPANLATPVDANFTAAFNGFTIQPIQAQEKQSHMIGGGVVPTTPVQPEQEQHSQPQDGSECSIGDQFDMIKMMSVKKPKHKQPPTSLGFLGVPSPNRHQSLTTGVYGSPRTPLSRQPLIPTPSPFTPHAPIQVSAPSPTSSMSPAVAVYQPMNFDNIMEELSAPSTPYTPQSETHSVEAPATPHTPHTPHTPPPQTPSGRSQSGPFALSSYVKGNLRYCELGIRNDLAPADRKFTLEAIFFCVQTCMKMGMIAQNEVDLKVASDVRAELCKYSFDEAESKLQFTMPKDCKPLDNWLHENRGNIDFRDRQLILQQVINLLATVHTLGNTEKLSLWGSFVVWVAPDMRVYILLDFPEMLCKMEKYASSPSQNPRIEDVKSVYELYEKILKPSVQQNSSWISPGVNQLLASFEHLLADPSSVYRMAELARTLGERRLCKLEVDYMSLDIIIYCIEHEALQRALSHLTNMVCSQEVWKAQWVGSGRDVGSEDVASAHRRMLLRVVPLQRSVASANDQGLIIRASFPQEGF